MVNHEKYAEYKKYAVLFVKNNKMKIKNFRQSFEIQMQQNLKLKPQLRN